MGLLHPAASGCFVLTAGAAQAAGGRAVTAGCSAIPYLFDLVVQRRVCYELVIKFL